MFIDVFLYSRDTSIRWTTRYQNFQRKYTRVIFCLLIYFRKNMSVISQIRSILSFLARWVLYLNICNGFICSKISYRYTGKVQDVNIETSICTSPISSFRRWIQNSIFWMISEFLDFLDSIDELIVQSYKIFQSNKLHLFQSVMIHRTNWITHNEKLILLTSRPLDTLQVETSPGQTLKQQWWESMLYGSPPFGTFIKFFINTTQILLGNN